MAKLLPFTVRVAADPDTVADPRVVLPRVKVTVPVGEPLPLAGFTVAVKTVLPEDEIVAWLAATVVVVPTSAVTLVEPLELAKLPSAAKVALMVLLPIARLLPWTARVAVVPEIVADPRMVLPTVKVTVPAGALVPLAGFTVAVNTVLAEERMVAGFAASVVVVPVVATTAVEPLELEKLPEAA